MKIVNELPARNKGITETAREELRAFLDSGAKYAELEQVGKSANHSRKTYYNIRREAEFAGKVEVYARQNRVYAARLGGAK